MQDTFDYERTNRIKGEFLFHPEIGIPQDWRANSSLECRTLMGNMGERIYSRMCESPYPSLSSSLETPASESRSADLERSGPRRVNVETGVPEDRPMTTGLHTVRDVMCAKCGEVLGWKYGSFDSVYYCSTTMSELTR